MRRSYGYTSRQNSGWDTTSQDYHAHISRMERMPTVIPDAPQYPNVHKVFNNKYNFEEEVELQEEHHRKQHSPEKVQLAEHVEIIEETRDEDHQAYEETTVDAEADGYIQQKHKGFELCKWKTFKVH